MIIKSNHALCENTNHVHLLLLHFGHAIVGREWAGKNSSLGLSRLYYIIRGTAQIATQDGETYTLSAGHWYILPADCAFDFSCDESMEHFYFHLKLCDLDGLDLLSALQAPVSLTEDEDKTAFFLSCLSSDSLADGLLMRHALERVLFAMLEKNKMRPENNRFSPVVVKAIKYIKRHLSAQLTVTEIAEHVFVSTSTLSKRFKAELSMSVGEYVNDRIMFEACQRLLKTNLSILAISEKYGFSDQFYFSRRFKEKFGLSPLKYRKTVIM